MRKKFGHDCKKQTKEIKQNFRMDKKIEKFCRFKSFKLKSPPKLISAYQKVSSMCGL